MVKGYIIASIVIGVMCVIGFLGIWFWFPRAFAWGNKQEMIDADAELAPEGSSREVFADAREKRRAMSRGIIERAMAREQALKRGEAPSNEPIVPREYYEARDPNRTHYPPLPAVELESSARHDGPDAPPAY